MAEQHHLIEHEAGIDCAHNQRRAGNELRCAVADKAHIEANGGRVNAHREKREYGDALLLLSTAREPVDAFFDKVMVMVEDEKVRANRLALLRTLLKDFSTIADFSEIVTESKN